MIRYTALTLAALLLAGCASISPPSHYYTLAYPSAGTTSDQSGLRLGIGPVEIPELIDRREIVVRTGTQQVEILSFDLWGGSAREEVRNRLGRRLAERLETGQLHFYPFRGTAVDVQVRVEVLQLIGSLDSEAELVALWQLEEPGRKGEATITRSVYRQAVAQATVSGMVDTYGALLDRLAGDIAAQIRRR